MLIDILLYFINGVIGLFVVISSILHRIFLFFRFLGEVKKILSSKTPVNFGFFVTSKCNMLCKHCFYWKEIIDAKNRKELSLEEIMQISKNLDTMYYLTITGGEPSLREDLPLICKVFYDNNCARMFSYHTNGYDTKAIVSQITDIMNLCPDAKVNVGISLDGPKDIHDVVRGRNGSYDRAIRTLKELRKCQVNSQNLDIQMCGTFSNYTYKKAKRFSRSIREKYGVYHGWTLIRGNPNCSTAKKVSAEDYISIHNVLRKTEDKRRFHSSLYWFIRQIVGRQIPLTIFFILKKKRQIIPCLAGNRTIVLYDNGDVAPCEVLEKNMGNIREFNYDMKKLLGNPRALQILNIISSKRCHCTHEGNLYVNLLFNFRTYLRALNSYIKTIR